MAAFTTIDKMWVVVAETVCPTKKKKKIPHYLLSGPLQKDVCWPLSYKIQTEGGKEAQAKCHLIIIYRQ